MTPSSLAKVYFLRVTDNASKLYKLCTLIHAHFAKNDRMLIYVTTNEAALYLDQLLWKMPEESFMPHAIASSATKEPIVITTSAANINQATTLINLSPSIAQNFNSIHLIYELLDLTSKEKEAVSQTKKTLYQTAGHLVEEIH